MGKTNLTKTINRQIVDYFKEGEERFPFLEIRKAMLKFNRMDIEKMEDGGVRIRFYWGKRLLSTHNFPISFELGDVLSLNLEEGEMEIKVMYD